MAYNPGLLFTKAIQQSTSELQLSCFKNKICDFAQALPGDYRGSRRGKARYSYPNTTLANFIELAEDATMEPAEFREMLRQVKGVTAVELHKSSKDAQGNFGAQNPNARERRKGHYQAHNFIVFSKLFPGEKGMEFELTERLQGKLLSSVQLCYLHISYSQY